MLLSVATWWSRFWKRKEIINKVDTISMELSILYFKGFPVKVSLKNYCSYIKIDFILANSAGPDEMPPLSGISSGSSLFAKVPVNENG